MFKISKDKDYKCMKIRVKDNNIVPFLYGKMKSTKHFENILLILINEDYKNNNSKNFNDLTSGEVMRAVLRDNEGGKVKDRVSYIKKYYENNSLMEQLIEVSKCLKIHNLVEQIKDIKKNYESYFTKLKNGHSTAKPPKPKKLSKVNKVTIFMDGYKSWSYKHRKKSKQNKVIGFNLSNKMRYTHIPHEHILKVVGDMENINNININYSNGNFYFLINYENKRTYANENIKSKHAGIDPGLSNLLSIYIEDESSKSLIIDGKPYIAYNSKFNRLMGKINGDIAYFKNLDDSFKKELDVQTEIKKLNRFRKFLYEKRNNYFFSEFHKLSVRVLEYLKLKCVTNVYIPKNLAYLKNNGECNLVNGVKQNFIQIPFLQLIKNIEYKAYKYGIQVIIVDESFTSKTSSLSQDINKVKSVFDTFPKAYELIKNDKTLSANVFKGKRAKRSLKETKGHRGNFYDMPNNVFINSDLNGARNICNIGQNKFSENNKLFKLCNPIKLKCDGELVDFIKSA